jgi:hypothetical protein
VNEMSKINRYYFAFDGVLIASFRETILEVLNSKSPSAGISLQDLKRLTKELYVGKISGNDYFAEITRLSGAKVSAVELADLVIDRVKVVPGVNEVLQELAQDYSIYIFSQLPTDIYGRIIQKLGLGSPDMDKTIFSNQLSLSGWDDAVFKKMALGEQKLTDACMWVDADSHMTSAAIRAGIHAIIFVDSRRLRREIALRGLLPLLGGE